jgi:hypothetical protein
MADETASERRHLERFSIKAVAVVQTVSAGTERIFELSTRDISSGGAFFPMEVPLPTGEKVKVTLFISLSALDRFRETSNKAKITTRGEVIRSDTQGIAVEFGRHYSITPLPA